MNREGRGVEEIVVYHQTRTEAQSPIPVQLADLSSPIWSSLTLLYIGQSFDSDQRLLLLTRADIYILR